MLEDDGNYIVKTSNLTKIYKDRRAVNGVNLKIKKGEVYGFLGPNGAGKTTTIKMLLGLIKPSKGDIKVLDMSLENNRFEILKNVGSLVEAPAYYSHLTAFENLLINANILGLPKERITTALDMVKLSSFADKPVKEFSLGMKQRLGIASALLAQPELLILDEPTNGLDPAGIIDMRELIRNLNKNYGVTIIISSHLLSEVEHVASHLGIIARGQILFEGSIKELKNIMDKFIVLTTSDATKTLFLANSIGCEAVKEDNEIHISNILDSELAKLIKELVRSEVDIYRVEERSQSLEDIFLGLVTGEETLC
ncbi:ABC transporter ATP-binding protein [Ureibacillus aquaedulcis]|uniref:ABC transporter ATP-binding protein n=1 Tax=Ureibacillus aquaedulcis TaxID=3058421 RepID=A0ABT8GVU8_9BACL|nr:ABC transporter ATP-binding protein [Ureibacillus sp. BA0131]MDN4495535.1 ABC transporter ATP-binding protein [Ureibacillus sp. BA0131]